MTLIEPCPTCSTKTVSRGWRPATPFQADSCHFKPWTIVSPAIRPIALQSSTTSVSSLSADCKTQGHYTSFFFNVFSGKMHVSHFGATGTPILDFWWRPLWISKPMWVLPYLRCWGECNVHSLRCIDNFSRLLSISWMWLYCMFPISTSGATLCQLLDGQHCGAVIYDDPCHDSK